MTNWLPNIQQSRLPKYLSIADAIEADIDKGELSPGTKLPPLRNIAFDLDVTVGTVSRAYALARERGLVAGEVGRGTYVLGQENWQLPADPLANPMEMKPANTAPRSHSNDKAGINKSDDSKSDNDIFYFSYTSVANIGQSKIINKVSAEVANRHSEKVVDYTREMPQHWRMAGAKWLSTGGWKPDTDQIIATNGAHAGAIAIIVSVTVPGDQVVFENLTYCSIARSTTLLGRRITTCDSDREGLLPDAFEKLCAQKHPKLLYLMPSIQNPTLTKLSFERRVAIADIAHRHNVMIIEDEIYGPLADDSIAPMAALAPELTFHVGGLSKSVSAGLRSGWIACPPRFTDRITNAHKMLTGGIPFWLAEIAANLVEKGDAAKICKQIRAENRQRTKIAETMLEGANFKSHPYCPYIWLDLPEPWLSGTFKNALAKIGIRISDEDDFKPMRSDRSFHGARIGLTSPEKASDLRAPLAKIKAMLDSGAAGYDIHE